MQQILREGCEGLGAKHGSEAHPAAARPPIFIGGHALIIYFFSIIFWLLYFIYWTIKNKRISCTKMLPSNYSSVITNLSAEIILLSCVMRIK